MTRTTTELDKFCDDFLLHGLIWHHSEVRTEELAAEFRERFELPAFPSWCEIIALRTKLGIRISQQHTPSRRIAGFNFRDGESHAVVLLPDLRNMQLASTFLHELREIIERTFAKVVPAYVALDTRDHRAMDRESDHFAACLLLDRTSTAARLEELGYDFAAFARERSVPLSTVVLRAQEIYSAKSDLRSPVSALWLLQTPYALVRQNKHVPDDAVVRYGAHLSGFSLHRKGRDWQERMFAAFPQKGASAMDFDVSRLCALTGSVVRADYIGVGEGGMNYLVVAQPITVVDAIPTRILMSALPQTELPRAWRWIHQLRPARSFCRSFLDWVPAA